MVYQAVPVSPSARVDETSSTYPVPLQVFSRHLDQTSLTECRSSALYLSLSLTSFFLPRRRVNLALTAITTQITSCTSVCSSNSKPWLLRCGY